MKNWCWIGLFLVISYDGVSQKVSKDSVTRRTQPVVIADTTMQAASDTAKALLGKNGKKRFVPVPKRAARLAFIPGGGQLYNRDYWKLPLIYLSMGGGIYAYHLNSIKYQDFLKAYKSFYNPVTGELAAGVTTDTKKIVRVRNLFNTSSTLDSASRDAIDRQKNYWRRNKNLSIIVTGLIYTLTIVEANVAAHLKTFDLSDDLTFRLEPKFSQPLMRQPAPGLRLVFNFK